MPLRDHFRPPLDDMRHWEGFHATWPVMLVANLRKKLPRRYYAEPRVHSGSSAEIDVATFETEGEGIPTNAGDNGNGGVATAVYAPPRPTLSVLTDLPSQDVYEVRIYDEKRKNRLVAAVEIVSPANKDRSTKRGMFVGKCAGLIREGVSVVIVDIVTTRMQNLYEEMLDSIGHNDPTLGSDPPPLYVAVCRLTKPGEEWTLEAWTEKLALDQALPTVPLWLAENLAVPLELEASYEESCGILGIP